AFVFVSSESGTGDLSTWTHAGGMTGIAAADHVCRYLANQAGLPQPPSFVAWLSVAGAPAIDRLTLDGPWRRVGGVLVAPDAAALIAAADTFHNALTADIEAD